MSASGAQNRLTSLSKKTKNVFDPDALLGINALPHNAQYEDQKKQDERGRVLAAQQADDAANAAKGPQDVALRESLFGDVASAGSALRTGNSADVAGYSPAAPRRRSAASRSLTGY